MRNGIVRRCVDGQQDVLAHLEPPKTTQTPDYRTTRTGRSLR
jgi:hypothetical protein